MLLRKVLMSGDDVVKFAMPFFKKTLSLLCAVFSINTFAVEFAAIDAKYLYEVVDDNKSIAYIFGSSHAGLDLTEVRLSQCVKNIMPRVDEIYLEMDQIALYRHMVSVGKFMPVAYIEKYIDSDILQSILSSLYGPDEKDYINKWRLLDARNLLLYFQQKIPSPDEVMYGSNFGLDVEVRMIARYLNKNLMFIELPEEQVRFFKQVPPKIYAEALVSAFNLTNNPEAAKKYYEDNNLTLSATAEGAESLLLKLINDDPFYEMNNRTITARNPSLASKIEEAVFQSKKSKKTSAFIALGAMHLPGPEGVPQLLAAKGYSVKRICQ